MAEFKTDDILSLQKNLLEPISYKPIKYIICEKDWDALVSSGYPIHLLNEGYIKSEKIS